MEMYYLSLTDTEPTGSRDEFPLSKESERKEPFANSIIQRAYY